MTVDIQEMKKRLEAKRAEIQQNIAGLTEAYPQPNENGIVSQDAEDFEDTAVDFQEMQQEQSIMVNEQALLTEVEEALKRIEAGTYGRCTACGEQIPDKRLEAMPWVALCVKDEERLEQRNLSREELYDEDTV